MDAAVEVCLLVRYSGEPPGQGWGVSWALRADWSEQASQAQAEQDMGLVSTPVLGREKELAGQSERAWSGDR